MLKSRPACEHSDHRAILAIKTFGKIKAFTVIGYIKGSSRTAAKTIALCIAFDGHRQQSVVAAAIDTLCCVMDHLHMFLDCTLPHLIELPFFCIL